MERFDKIFKSFDVKEFNESVFNLIGQKWFLLTAGNEESFNIMTASWGTMGVLWNRPVAMCFIRPSRNTFVFVEDCDVYTMSFLGEEHRSILNFCGAHSGRDVDKISETGLKPLISENGGISFEQAEIVVECRKLYFDDIKPVFLLQEEIDMNYYSDNDYHRMYIGEITSMYKK